MSNTTNSKTREPHVVHELLVLDGLLFLRTAVYICGEWHHNQEALKDEYTMRDLREIMRVSREKLGRHVASVFVGSAP